MSSSQHRTLWYKSKNYVWLEKIKDQDDQLVENATISGTVKDASNNQLDTVSFTHDADGNYVAEIPSDSKVVKMDYGSSVIMDLTVEHSGGKHFISLIFTIEIDRA